MSDILTRLGEQIDARRDSDASESYTASLFQHGDDTILKKVGEEAVEFILAAKGDDSSHLVAEAADVWFHMLVMLSAKGLGPSDILNELQRREGVSGHAEKASRTKED
jgi:phosphoribosyl-ATP pyrophosphohydrolase